MDFEWFRRNRNDIKFFVHNKVDEKEVDRLISNLSIRDMCGDGKDDDEYHIVSAGKDTLIYRIRNEVYIIPAKVNPTRTAVIDNNDGSKPIVALYFDYPCEMKREDLVEY